MVARTKKTLEDFQGTVFQDKFVKSLMENPSKFAEIEGYLSPDYFSTPGLQQIIKVMKDYYEEKGKVPTYSVLEYLLKDAVQTSDEFKSAAISFKMLKECDTDGIAEVLDLGVNYVSGLALIRELENAIRRVKERGYTEQKRDEIVEIIQRIGNNASVSYTTPGDLFEKIMNESEEDRVPSFIPQLDKQMNGGLLKGTTGLLVAGTGVGKTTLMSIMACNAACHGYKTLYIWFEDKDTDIGRKFYSCVTRRYTTDFMAGSPNQEAAEKDIRQKFKDNPSIKEGFYKNLKLLKLPNGSTTVEELTSKVRAFWIKEGWIPDVVFIDYMSCLAPSSDKKMAIEQEFVALDKATKKLDAFAQEQNFALWIAQQTNREGAGSGSKSDADDASDIQGSWRIKQTASAVLVLKRDKNREDWNEIVLTLDKCRGGEPHKWKHAYLNNGTCQINLEDQRDYKDEKNCEDVPF